MTAALYICDGITQIILTPQTEFEKATLSALEDPRRSLSIRSGQFYECQGGYVRQGPRDESTILVLRPTPPPATLADPDSTM